MAIAGFIFALLSLLLSCCLPGVNVVLAAVAIILCIIALRQPKNRGLAIAGLVIGGVAAIIGVLMVTVIGTMIASPDFQNQLLQQYEGQPEMQDTLRQFFQMLGGGTQLIR